MSAPKIETVSPSKIAEVKAFMKAKEALDELRALFPVAFAKLAEIAAVYNTTLDAAAEAVKIRRVSSGPFDLYSYTKKFDAEVLYADVGRQKFAQMGGIIDPREIRDVDKTRFLALIETKVVSPALAAKVLTYAPSFHKPDPIVLPRG
jgi:hypothetical protein